MMGLNFWIPEIISGLAYGSIYGLFGLSIVLLYRANHIINFAATEIATFVVIIMFFLLKKMGYFPALFLAILAGFMVGLCLHFLIMRWITERKRISNIAQFQVTMGLFFIFNSLSSYIFGDEPERFPLPFKSGFVQLFGFSISYHILFIWAITAVCLLFIYLFFRFTDIGLKFEAVAEDIHAARQRGVRASYILAIAWGMAVALAAVAGTVIAPTLFLTPFMLLSILNYGLISVVIGGLESPLGAWSGGLLVGLVENLASNIPFIGSELKFAAVLIFLVVFLLVKPRGLWGKQETRKV